MAFKLDRREFLVAAGASGMAMSFPALPAVLAQQATGGSVKPELANVKACVFDTFGTVVDWRGSVIGEATSWGKAKGLNINWARSPTAGGSDTCPRWRRYGRARFR